MGAPKTFEKCSAGSSLAPPSAPGLIRNNRTKSIRPFQVDYGEVHPAVLEGCQDLLHPALLPPSLPSKLVEIQKIDVVKIEKVKVEVILSAGAKRRGLEKVIARLLRGLALSHGCWVAAEGKYGLVGVVVKGVVGVVRLEREGEVVISKITGERRLQLIEEGKNCAQIGGVTPEREKLVTALRRKEHCLVCGPGIFLWRSATILYLNLR